MSMFLEKPIAHTFLLGLTALEVGRLRVPKIIINGTDLAIFSRVVLLPDSMDRML